MMKNYDKLAHDILNLNKMDNDFLDIKIDFRTANKLSNDFYKIFFMNKRNGELKSYEAEIEYSVSSNLKPFEGLSRLGTYKSYIDISDKESIKRVPVLMHEKAHVYEKLNHKSKNEFIPTFFEILFTLKIDNNMLSKTVLNYKISEAKKAANIYLRTKNDNALSYMLDFYRSINLLITYLNDCNLVTKSLDENFFMDKDSNQIIDEFYLDDDKNSISNKINIITKKETFN